MFKRVLTAGLLISLFFASASYAVESPFDRGCLLLGGGGTYMSIAPDNSWSDENVNLTIIYPTVGYFVSKRMCAGVTLLLGKLSMGETEFSTSAIGPQLTYYFASRKQLDSYTGRAVPYLTASALIGVLSEGGADINVRSYILGGGAVAMISKNVGGFCELSYSFDHLKATEPAASIYDTEDETIYDGTRFGVQLGVRLFVW